MSRKPIKEGAIDISIEGVIDEITERQSKLWNQWYEYHDKRRLKTWIARRKFLDKVVSEIRDLRKLKQILKDLITVKIIQHV